MLFNTHYDSKFDIDVSDRTMLDLELSTIRGNVTTSTSRTRKTRATMQDVARRAGVGVKTVSRVINGEPHVSAETAARVMRAVEEEHYRPDVRAGLLRSRGPAHVIGLLLGSRNNPFSTLLQSAVEDCAREHEAVLMTSYLDSDAALEKRAIDSLVNHRVDGLVIASPTHDLSYLQREREYGLALSLIDAAPGTLDCNTFTSDSRAGMQAAVEHLVSNGHRRIAYLGPRRDVYTIAERRRGFLDATRQLGLRVPDEWLIDDVDVVDAIPIISNLLLSRDVPTALVSSQNEVTVEVVRALRALGLQNSVALVGFDDFPLADLLEPAITVLQQDVTLLATEATESLFEQVRGEANGAEARILPVTLVERGSGEMPPAASV